MTAKNDYQSSINEVFFNTDTSDTLFKDSVKPYIKDEYRFKRAVSILGNPKGKEIYEVGPYPGTGVYYFGEANNILGLGKSNSDFLNKFQRTGHKLIDIDFEFASEIKGLHNADIVLVMEVLEHIRMSYKFLENISKMVKPGGLIYLTTNNQSYIGYIMKLFFNKAILDPIETEKTFYPGHCRYYDVNELVNVFEKFGFKIVRSGHINFLPDYKLYKNEGFGAIKNALIKILPKRFSTHIELLIKRPE